MRLEICGVSKLYKKKRALEKINLAFDNGIYAILGPNGAGKTTLINIIAGVIPVNEGQVLFHGVPIKNDRETFLEDFGYMPQHMPFYGSFTALEMMQYIGILKGLDHNKAKSCGLDLLKKVNLYDDRDRQIKAFSGGMKQRLGIAQALIHDPSVLIFDEPTAGLDPRERIRFRNVISKFGADKTIIICTHIVPDIDAIADQIILLKQGSVISQKTSGELCDELRGKLWDIAVTNEELEYYLANYQVYQVSRNERNQYKLRIFSDGYPPSLTAKESAVTLEDVYLYHFTEERDNVFSI